MNKQEIITFRMFSEHRRNWHESVKKCNSLNGIDSQHEVILNVKAKRLCQTRMYKKWQSETDINSKENKTVFGLDNKMKKYESTSNIDNSESSDYEELVESSSRENSDTSDNCDDDKNAISSLSRSQNIDNSKCSTIPRAKKAFDKNSINRSSFHVCLHAEPKIKIIEQEPTRNSTLPKSFARRNIIRSTFIGPKNQDARNEGLYKS